MPNASLQQLISTILGFREINVREKANQLTEARNEVEKRATQAQMLSGLMQQMRQSVNPVGMIEPQIGEHSTMTGYSPEALMSMAKNTTPSLETQTAGAAQQYGDQKALGLRATTGMNPAELAKHYAYLELPKEEQVQGAGVEQGTRLSAGQDAQKDLGYAQLRDSHNQWVANLGIQQMELKAKLKKATDEDVKENLNKQIEVTQAKNKLFEVMLQAGSTTTPAGVAAYAQQYNQLEAYLSGLDPNYKPTFLDPSSTLTARSMLEFLKTQIKGGK
jgi:hypothetical protein